MRRRQGFTLLELMIVLAIIAIVGAIALPSFMNSIRKGRRSDASDAAAAVLQSQERVRANSATYSGNLATLNVPATSANGYYTLALSGATATAYTLTMTPVAAKGQQNDTGCTSLVVAVSNGNPAYSPATCWSR